jgi:hypothetical protein
VPLQRRIHPTVQFVQLQRISADQMGRQLFETGAATRRIGGQIEWPQRADFAIADHPFIGVDAHHRAVEDRDRFAARPLVTALMERQIDLIDRNFADFHG